MIANSEDYVQYRLGRAQRRIEEAIAAKPIEKPRDLGQLVLDVAVSFDLPSKLYFMLDDWARRNYLEKFR